MLKTTPLKQVQVLLFVLLFSFTVNAQVGINTDTPAYQFQMINSGNVGATAMSEFTNNSNDGVSLAAFNSSTTNGFNAFEGITTGIFSGVFGLAISQDNGAVFDDAIGVFGQTNDFQGIGVAGVRATAGGPDIGFGGLFFSDLGYTGGLFNISDIRTKKDINPIDDALSKITNLNPVSYYYDTDKYPTLGLNTNLEYGFISQEVKNILPNITKEKLINTLATINRKRGEAIENKSEKFLMLDYTRFIPILTQGIKEQQVIIENQNKKIETLEKKLADLESKVNAIINKND